MVTEVGFQPISQQCSHHEVGCKPIPQCSHLMSEMGFEPRNLNAVIMVRVRSGIQTLDLNEITNTMMSKVGYQPKPQCSHHAWCQKHNMNPYLYRHHGARSGIWMSIDDMFLSITWDHKSRCFVFILRTDSNCKCTTLYKATPMHEKWESWVFSFQEKVIACQPRWNLYFWIQTWCN